MRSISREAIQRMIEGDGFVSGGSGGSGLSQIESLLSNYATELWVDENYISIEFFSRLFQAHGTENGQQTDIDPNDTTSTITSIESMFGFWTDYYLSALGNGGGLGSTLYLSTLADVRISSPADGQVLTYNVSLGQWVNANAQAGVTQLSALSDVTLTTPTYGDVLLYDGTKWINSALKTINSQSLIGSGNISVGGGASGNYLPLTGGTLVGQVQFNFNAVETGSFRYGELRFSGGVYLDRWCNIVPPSDSGYWSVYKSDRSDDNKNFEIDLSNSHIGIGKKATSYYLDINGTCHASNYFTDDLNQNNSPTAFPTWINNDSKQGFSFTPEANMPFISKNGGSFNGEWTMTFDNNGNIILSSRSGSYWHIDTSGGTNVLTCNSNSYVGIGVTSPSYKLHVDGTIYATGAVTALSDIRKKDVLSTDIGLTVEQIADAPTIKFLWKDRRNEGIQVGCVAQFWAANLPEVVMDKGGELSMQYGVAALVSTIITARKVVDHERRISELEKENERLKTEVEQLRLN